MEEIVKMISNVGFPIAISCFLLVRIESKISELIKSINELNQSISRFDK